MSSCGKQSPALDVRAHLDHGITNNNNNALVLRWMKRLDVLGVHNSLVLVGVFADVAEDAVCPECTDQVAHGPQLALTFKG